MTISLYGGTFQNNAFNAKISDLNQYTISWFCHSHFEVYFEGFITSQSTFTFVRVIEGLKPLLISSELSREPAADLR